MSKLSIGVLVGAIFCIIASGFLVYRFDQENFRLRCHNEFKDNQIRLLEDQLRDYEFKISSRPTYEAGYRDALVKSESGTYDDGFEAAKVLYKTGGYDVGYHNAIQQHSPTWMRPMSKKELEIMQEKIELGW